MTYKTKLQLILLTGLFYVFLHWIGVGCPIRYSTGIPCAGCGMSRAAACAVRLDFTGAFYFHPLFPVIPVLLVLFFVYEKISKRFLWGIGIGLIVLFAVVYLYRMFIAKSPVLVEDIEGAPLLRLWNQVF